jgi:hypothetical protein
MGVWNSGQVSSVEGAELKAGKLEVVMPVGPEESYLQKEIVLHFGKS